MLALVSVVDPQIIVAMEKHDEAMEMIDIACLDVDTRGFSLG